MPGGKWSEAPSVPGSRGSKTMVKAFAEAVLSGEPAMTGWDGRQVLTIVVAAYRSAETHKSVNLPI